MSKKRIVIKYGGHAMDKQDLCLLFAKSVSKLYQNNYEIIIVHGGGPQINDLLKRLDIPSIFKDGLRVTDQTTMQAVEMVLAGQVNKDLVSLFSQAGLQAVGLSGKDSKILEAEILAEDFGLVGQVSKVNTALLELLLEHNYLTILAPIAYGEQGQSLNINADLAAGAIAGALQADAFILVTDVAGVLDANKELICELNRSEIEKLKQSGVIYGGMLPKLESCLFALDAHCKEAIILDGREASSLERYLLQNEKLGTKIKSE